MSDAQTEPGWTATTTPELATWLLARIAEDETAARDTIRERDDGYPPAAASWHEAHEPASGVLDVGADVFPLANADLTRFIARHDPARVLAECEAKRRIVELHQTRYITPADDPFQECLVDQDDYPCTTLRLLALPYADRDGYREEWKP